jgi:CRISPR/Cas system CSM-associated protein Csm2 small subunit
MGKMKTHTDLKEIETNSGFTKAEIANAIEAAGNIDKATKLLNETDQQGRRIYRSEVRSAAKLLKTEATA